MSDPIFLRHSGALNVLKDLLPDTSAREGVLHVNSQRLTDVDTVIRRLKEFAGSGTCEGWVCCAHRADLCWIEEEELDLVRWPEAAELCDKASSLHLRHQSGEWLLTEFTEAEGNGLLLHKTFVLTGAADLLGYDVAFESISDPIDPTRRTWCPVASRYTGRERHIDGGE